MNCDKYSVICSKNKTNGIQAELLKLKFVLHELVLLDIGIAVDVLFIFVKNFHTHSTITLHVYITSEFLSVLCLIVDLPTDFFIWVGSDKS
jgi:hypothetical protein